VDASDPRNTYGERTGKASRQVIHPRGTYRVRDASLSDELSGPRSRPKAPQPGSGSAARVLCATDLSTRADQVEAAARELSEVLGGTLELVYVHEQPSDVMDERALWQPRRAAELRHEAAGKLALAAERLGHAVRGTFLEGDPRDLLLQYAATAGLLVVGAPRANRLPRFLSSGLVERLVRTSPVPVLVVPIVDEPSANHG
jgi:nucleotide-binding universal stress UspA family protein